MKPNSRLNARGNNNPREARVGVEGCSGLGKSFLAALGSHSRKSPWAYADGTVWVDLSSLLGRRPLHRRVHIDVNIDGEQAGHSRLKELLADKVLLVLDSDWEAEFCRVAESHPKVIAYTKNHNLGLEVPYRYGSETRKYRPDFIVRVDDGHGGDDLLNLIVEIKGYRREDAKEKKSTMETYWVPGVNHLKTYGRWCFAEFTEIYQIETDFAAKVESEFNKMIESATINPTAQEK